MNKSLALALSVASAAFALSGCASYQQEPAASAPPAASGKAIWAYMAKAGYTRNWSMWPGTSAYYKGNEPHGALLTTYVNAPALDAINGKRGTLPDGAMVIKENYMPGKNLAAITVMYKVAGYNPEAGDWYWVKFAPSGAVEAEGKEPMCIACHSAKMDNDYLYTGNIH